MTNHTRPHECDMKTAYPSAIKRCIQRFAIVLLILNVASSGNQSYAFELSPWKWPQTQLGAPVTLTYSYSNLFDGGLLDSSGQPVPKELLRASIEEALSLWADVAALNFIEVPDMGPTPSA